jgi:MFS family permease
MTNLALPLLVLGLTGSAVQAGLVGALGRLPYLLLGLVAGVLVDRLDRQRVMVVCEAGRALALGSVAASVWLGHLSLAQLDVVALIEGALFTGFNTAEAATLPTLVGREQLAAAFAQREGVWSAANVVGPALGGALFGLHPFLPFAADALSYMVSALTLLGLRLPQPPERGRGRGAPAVPRAIGEALSWLRHQPQVRYLTLLSLAFELALSGTILAVVVQARQQQATPQAIGVMLTLGALGTTAGYLVAPWLRRRFSLRRVVVSALGLLTVPWWLYALSPDPVVTGLLMAGAGGAASVYLVADVACRVARIPDELQGRLNSMFGVLSFGVESLSLALGGVLVQLLGAPGALVTFAVCPLVMALSAARTPHLRESTPALGSPRRTP